MQDEGAGHVTLFCGLGVQKLFPSNRQNCRDDMFQQSHLGCKMRVRVTNFTSLATVDFPLVLISGCVDNYSDQVILA